MEKIYETVRSSLLGSLQKSVVIGENDDLPYFLKGLGYKERRISILNEIFSLAKQNKDILTKSSFKVQITGIDELLYEEDVDLVIESSEGSNIEGDVIKIESAQNWVNIDYSWKLENPIFWTPLFFRIIDVLNGSQSSNKCFDMK
jgi:hypothetical protein